MNNTEKFTGKASVYEESRPKYAPEFISYLFNEVGLNKDSIVADIGSGTGIFTKLLLENDVMVYSVEPNEDMRTIAENSLSTFNNFNSINASAENTTLANNSIDFITVAQAFHWFDIAKFKIECKRILKTNGKVILTWNTRIDTAPLNIETAIIFNKYCPNYKGFNGGIDIFGDIVANFFNNKFIIKRFPNNLIFDKEKFIKRILSASYSLKKGDIQFDNYINEFELLFNKYSVNGILTIPNETVAYIGVL